MCVLFLCVCVSVLCEQQESSDSRLCRRLAVAGENRLGEGSEEGVAAELPQCWVGLRLFLGQQLRQIWVFNLGSASAPTLAV